MFDFVFLTVVKFVLLQGIGTLHPSAAVPPPRASHDRGWIGILLGILAVLVLIIILIVLLFYLRYVMPFLMEMYGNALPLPFAMSYTILLRPTRLPSHMSHNHDCKVKRCRVMSRYVISSPVTPLSRITSRHYIRKFHFM